MAAKIVRIIFIFLSVMVMALYLPTIYKKRFEQRPDKTMLYYSEITKDFIVARESGDSINDNKMMIYYDRNGEMIDEVEAAKLLPFWNMRKLRLLGAMPDSIDGIQLTDSMLRNIQRTMIIPETGFTYQINPLFESQSERVGVSMPDDLFYIDGNGIQFVDAQTKTLDVEKKQLFNEALSNNGFVAPSQSVYGIPSNIKRRDDGYFIVDNQGTLFHLIMVKGKPVCRKITSDIDVKRIQCHAGGDLFAHIFDDDNNVYALTRNYEIKKVLTDIPQHRPIMVVSNCFYRTYKLMGADSTSLFVFTPDFRAVDHYTVQTESYSKSQEAEVERYIFPFKLMLTPGYVHLAFIPNPIGKFILVNLVLAVLFTIIRVIRKQRLLTPFNLIDILLILVLGIYAFIATILFPNRDPK